MLYDRSGFKLNTAVKYLQEILSRRDYVPANWTSYETLSTIILHWWDQTPAPELQSLAIEATLGGSRRSKFVSNQLSLQALTDWIQWANVERGIAPTRADVASQYAVVKNLDLSNEILIRTIGHGDLRNEGNRSFWKRYVKKWCLKRSKIVARPKLNLPELRTQACPPFLLWSAKLAPSTQPPFALLSNQTNSGKYRILIGRAAQPSVSLPAPPH